MTEIQSKNEEKKGEMPLNPKKFPGSFDSECGTVDVTADSPNSPDDGHLNCIFRSGALNYTRWLHENTFQVADNILKLFHMKESENASVPLTKPPIFHFTAHIFGHGNVGLIVTGTGNKCCTDDKFMSTWNYDSWSGHLQMLNEKISVIKLWACHTGAEEDGVTFLHYLCQVTKAICTAPVGLVFCNNGIIDTGGCKWQTVYPDQPLPKAIPAPKSARKSTSIQTIKIMVGTDYEKISLGDIKSIEILTPDRQRVKRKLQNIKVTYLLNVIDFGSPFIVKGTPAAILTGYIRINFKEPTASVPHAFRDFIIWNDRIIEDADQRGYFYDVIGDLSGLMRIMLND